MEAGRERRSLEKRKTIPEQRGVWTDRPADASWQSANRDGSADLRARDLTDLPVALLLLCPALVRQFRRPQTQSRGAVMSVWSQENRAKSLISRSSVVTQSLKQNQEKVGV